MGYPAPMHLVLWLLACDSGPKVPAPADRAAYLSAATGSGDCDAIEDPSWASECHTFAAAALAESSDADGAWARCERISDPLWQDECRFVVTDELKLTGAEAAARCDSTGRFERDCVSHALVRDLRLLQAAHGTIGDELALAEELDVLAGLYAAEPDDHTGYLLFIHHLANRAGPQDFNVTSCGAASREACRDAYLLTLTSTPHQVDLAGVCASERTPEDLAEFGVRPYAPGSEEMAADALARFCALAERGEDPRIPGVLLEKGAPSLPMGSYLTLPAPWTRPGERRRGPPGQPQSRRGAR